MAPKRDKTITPERVFLDLLEILTQMHPEFSLGKFLRQHRGAPYYNDLESKAGALLVFKQKGN